LSRVFGFNLTMVMFQTYDFYDARAGRWMGITGEVLYIITENQLGGYVPSCKLNVQWK
jgi:hypothetical protein